MISPQPFLNSYSVPSEISAARVIVRMPAVTAPWSAPATAAQAARCHPERSRHTLAWLMQYPPARLDAICGLPSRTSLLANLDPEAPRRATAQDLSLIHISEPTRLLSISYAVFCLKK